MLLMCIHFNVAAALYWTGVSVFDWTEWTPDRGSEHLSALSEALTTLSYSSKSASQTATDKRSKLMLITEGTLEWNWRWPKLIVITIVQQEMLELKSFESDLCFISSEIHLIYLHFLCAQATMKSIIVHTGFQRALNFIFLCSPRQGHRIHTHIHTHR